MEACGRVARDKLPKERINFKYSRTRQRIFGLKYTEKVDVGTQNRKGTNREQEERRNCKGDQRRIDNGKKKSFKNSRRRQRRFGLKGIGKINVHRHSEYTKEADRKNGRTDTEKEESIEFVYKNCDDLSICFKIGKR